MAAGSVDLPLIPAPQAWQPSPGTWQTAGLAGARITATGRGWDELDAAVATWLAPFAADGATRLTIGQADLPGGPEAYRLVLAPERIELVGNTPAGAFRGLMSLVQLAHKAPPGGLPCGTIEDAPQHRWRGLMLDSGRHFQPVEVVKTVIDALALHRGNVFHWHLTEDQGWRLDVPGLPRLAEVAAWRTAPGGERVGGFYSAGDVRQIVAHAAARHITVVPEIEMPGHSVAALAAYPELSCTGGPFAVETQWGIHEDIYCAGNEAVFAFLEQVLTHVLDLFPGPYVHIGGDEAPRDRWRKCARCQQRITDEGLADEHELQSWFIARIERWLAARDRRLVGWDEIIDGGLLERSEGAVVQSWRGLRGARLAARADHDAISSPTSHAYFDYDPGVLDVQQVHGFDPVPDDLDKEAAARILGGAMNLWTEYVPPARVPRMLAPRLAAMTEALWTGTSAQDFPDFLARLRDHDPVWNALGWEPGATARPVRLVAERDPSGAGYAMTAELDDRLRDVFPSSDLAIRYTKLPLADLPTWTADGRPEEMGLPAPDHDTPTAWTETAAPGDAPFVVIAQAHVSGQSYGAPAALALVPHLGLDAPAALTHPPSSRYPGGTHGPLTDGRRGGPDHGDGRWAGFEGMDMVAELDLGEVVAAGAIAVNALQDANAWIFLPTEVTIGWSVDGRNWREAAVGHGIPHEEQGKLIHRFAVEPGTGLRHIRVTATNRRTCPEWHPGRGQPAWIFIDEIEVTR